MRLPYIKALLLSSAFLPAIAVAQNKPPGPSGLGISVVGDGTNYVGNARTLIFTGGAASTIIQGNTSTNTNGPASVTLSGTNPVSYGNNWWDAPPKNHTWCKLQWLGNSYVPGISQRPHFPWCHGVGHGVPDNFSVLDSSRWRIYLH